MKKSSVNFKDLTNKTFGELYVIKRATDIGIKPIKWECLCSCKKTTIVISGQLLSGKTKSCGCIKTGGYNKSKNKLEDKKCFYCNSLFSPERKSDKYCSIECREKYTKNIKYPSASKENNKNKMALWRMNNPAKRILSNINTRNNIDIDLEWIQERLDKGVCEVTGIKFETPEYGANATGFNHFPWTPSIDKVVPTLGYKKSNCKMVVWAYNRAKGLWTDDVVIKLAKGVINELDKQCV